MNWTLIKGIGLHSFQKRAPFKVAIYLEVVLGPQHRHQENFLESNSGRPMDPGTTTCAAFVFLIEIFAKHTHIPTATDCFPPTLASGLRELHGVGSRNI